LIARAWHRLHFQRNTFNRARQLRRPRAFRASRFVCCKAVSKCRIAPSRRTSQIRLTSSSRSNADRGLDSSPKLLKSAHTIRNWTVTTFILPTCDRTSALHGNTIGRSTSIWRFLPTFGKLASVHRRHRSCRSRHLSRSGPVPPPTQPLKSFSGESWQFRLPAPSNIGSTSRLSGAPVKRLPLRAPSSRL